MDLSTCFTFNLFSVNATICLHKCNLKALTTYLNDNLLRECLSVYPPSFNINLNMFYCTALQCRLNCI